MSCDLDLDMMDKWYLHGHQPRVFAAYPELARELRSLRALQNTLHDILRDVHRYDEDEIEHVIKQHAQDVSAYFRIAVGKLNQVHDAMYPPSSETEL